MGKKTKPKLASRSLVVKHGVICHAVLFVGGVLVGALVFEDFGRIPRGRTGSVSLAWANVEVEPPAQTVRDERSVRKRLVVGRIF